MRLLELKPVRVANFLPALVLAPLLLRLAEVDPRLAGLSRQPAAFAQVAKPLMAQMMNRTIRIRPIRPVPPP